MSKDSSAEDLDEEIAQLEEELAELDASEGSEEEGEEGKKRSLKDRVPFLGTSKDEDDETDADDTSEDTEDSDDEGPVGRLMGRFRSDADDEEPPEEDEASDQEEPDDDSTEETAPPSPPPEDDEPAQETPPPAAFDDDASPTEEAAGDEDEPGEPQEGARRESDQWVKTSEGWERRGPNEEPLADEPLTEEPSEEEDDGADARALLSRFRKDTDDEPQEAPADDPDDPPRPHEDDGDDEEEEDDRRGPFLIAGWILLALLLIAALAAAAIYFTGAGEDIEAQLSSDVIEQDGMLVAATGTPILFDASASTGTVEAYQWDFGDGVETTTEDATVTHTYEERGTYTVTITVEGNRASDETTRDVRVVDTPEATPNILLDGTPVAEPGEIGNNVFLGERVTLDASESTADADQEITSYEWDVSGDGSPDTTGAETTTTFDEAGAWEVLLTVTDDVGHTGTATRVVHVGDVYPFENETMPGPSPGEEEQTETHETGIDMARLGVQPIQIEAVLTYTSEEEEGDIVTSLEADLDLGVTSPDGESYQAEDDDGTGGEESLTLTGGDIDSLGTWTWEITRDVQSGLTGSVSQVEYTLVVHVTY